MRVKPTPLISIALLLIYMALVAAIWVINGVDCDAVADTSDTVLKGIIIPIGVVAVVLVAAATWLGWWRPAMVETSKVGPRPTAILALVVVAKILRSPASASAETVRSDLS